MPTVHLLDYVAGNVRSLVNAIEKLGYTVEWIKEPQDVVKAEVGIHWFAYEHVLRPQKLNVIFQKLILPGVGHFGHCLTQFFAGGYVDPIRMYIASGKPFMGICVGLQALLEGSEEDP